MKASQKVRERLEDKNLSVEDKKILKQMEAAFVRVENSPEYKALKEAEKETRRFLSQCSCPDFCYFHTPLI